MVVISDLPIQVGRREKLSRKAWLVLVLVGLMLSTVSWGLEDTIYVGSANGLEVQAFFSTIAGVGSGGTYLFHPGGVINYRIIVRNRGNSSFQNVQVQSSFHTDGAVCGSQVLQPENLLPGAAVSSLHTMNLDPMSTDEYDASYPVPADLCPSVGHLKIRLTYTYQSHLQAAELVCPLHFRFQ